VSPRQCAARQNLLSRFLIPPRLAGCYGQRREDVCSVVFLYSYYYCSTSLKIIGPSEAARDKTKVAEKEGIFCMASPPFH
jgi:hypothetical protein